MTKVSKHLCPFILCDILKTFVINLNGWCHIVGVPIFSILLQPPDGPLVSSAWVFLYSYVKPSQTDQPMWYAVQCNILARNNNSTGKEHAKQNAKNIVNTPLRLPSSFRKQIQLHRLFILTIVRTYYLSSTYKHAKHSVQYIVFSLA